MYHVSDQKNKKQQKSNQLEFCLSAYPGQGSSAEHRILWPTPLLQSNNIPTGHATYIVGWSSFFFSRKIWPCKDSRMHPCLSTPLPDPCFRPLFHLSHTAMSILSSVFNLLWHRTNHNSFAQKPSHWSPNTLCLLLYSALVWQKGKQFSNMPYTPVHLHFSSYLSVVLYLPRGLTLIFPSVHSYTYQEAPLKSQPHMKLLLVLLSHENSLSFTLL